MVKNPPAMQETWFDLWAENVPVEKGTNYSILVWRIPRTEEPGRLYNPRGCKELDTTERLSQDHNLSCYIILQAKFNQCYRDGLTNIILTQIEHFVLCKILFDK